MANRSLLRATIDRRDIAEDLWLLARAVGSDREVLKLLQVLDIILRRLHCDVVAHVILRIEIKGWRGLEASTQAGQHITGHIVLTEPYLLCPSPVDIDCP